MKKSLSKIKKLRPDKQLMLSLLITLLIAGLIYVLVSTKQRAKRNSVLQAESLPGALLLSPGAATVDAGQTINLTVTMDTGGTSAAGADVVMQYETNRFDVTGITPSVDTMASTGLKTFAPVISEADLSFSWQKAVNPATGVIDFGAVTFDPATQAPTTGVTTTAASPLPIATLNFQAKPVRKNTFSSVNFTAALNATNDSNISVTSPTVSDVLGTTNHSVIKIMAEPICRASIDTTDQVPSLNDLLWVVSKWGQTCSGCDEDLDNSANVGLGDLLYVTGYWGQNCSVPL